MKNDKEKTLAIAVIIIMVCFGIYKISRVEQRPCQNCITRAAQDEQAEIDDIKAGMGLQETFKSINDKLNNIQTDLNDVISIKYGLQDELSTEETMERIRNMEEL